MKINMGKDTTISITLEEYLEYKKLKEHSKKVEITEYTKHQREGHIGTTVTWASDGAVWSKLACKLNNAGEKINCMIKEEEDLKNKLREMSIWEFRKFKRNILKDYENRSRFYKQDYYSIRGCQYERVL